MVGFASRSRITFDVSLTAIHHTSVIYINISYISLPRVRAVPEAPRTSERPDENTFLIPPSRLQQSPTWTNSGFLFSISTSSALLLSAGGPSFFAFVHSDLAAWLLSAFIHQRSAVSSRPEHFSWRTSHSDRRRFQLERIDELCRISPGHESPHTVSTQALSELHLESASLATTVLLAES